MRKKVIVEVVSTTSGIGVVVMLSTSQSSETNILEILVVIGTAMWSSRKEPKFY